VILLLLANDKNIFVRSLLLFMGCVALTLQAGVRPLALRAHAHNDYQQARPLIGAMEQKFGSIEADVFLVNGRLLVSHDREHLTPERNLVDMYLKPMAEAVAKNHGSLYPEKAEVILLVDIKDDAAGVYQELKKELAPYTGILTHYHDGKVDPGAIKVILSGDRPIDLLKGEADRYAFIDGRMEDLEPTPSPKELVPLVSMDFNDVFKWKGDGEMPAEDRERLQHLVQIAHTNGQILRFWASPETKETWKTLYDAGVDLIGTDKQAELAQFLAEQK